MSREFRADWTKSTSLLSLTMQRTSSRPWILRFTKSVPMLSHSRTICWGSTRSWVSWISLFFDLNVIINLCFTYLSNKDGSPPCTLITPTPNVSSQVSLSQRCQIACWGQISTVIRSCAPLVVIAVDVTKVRSALVTSSKAESARGTSETKQKSLRKWSRPFLATLLVEFRSARDPSASQTLQV